MTNDQTQAVKQIVGVNVAWLGSISLAQVQIAVGIASGLAVLVYTLMKMYFLWKNGGKGESE